MPPYLPGEITDRIIWSVPDVHCGFHSDYKTLLSCALVCQQWHPASRAALLDYVGIHNKAAYDSFIHHVLHSERMTPYLDLTRTLWMHETPAQDGNDLTLREQSWSYRFIHDFAGHFPNLRQLSIWSVDWCSLPPHPSIHGSISRFTALRSLDLRSCRLPSWNTVRRLVTALSPSLNSLTLWDVTCVSARDRAALMHPAARAPSLTTLKLICHWGDEDSLIPFLGWLSHTAARHSLRRLVLSRGGLSQEYMGFLLAVAPVITELDISDISSSAPNFPFRELENLQVLELQLMSSWKSSWSNVSRMLLKIPSRLHRITLHLFLEEQRAFQRSPFEDQGLETLDAALQDDNVQWQNLKQVVFRLYSSGSSRDRRVSSEAEKRVVEAVNRKLPRLISRGIVAVRTM